MAGESLGDRGLTAAAARARLDQVGPNEPAATHHTTALFELVHLFANPLIAILLVASAISMAVGEWINATIIIAMVLLGIIINFTQTYHSRRAVERLRKSVAPTATVLRDGAWIEVSRQEVVPDDWIRLTPGDLVPADARINECTHIHLQESALTGESLPVEKQTGLFRPHVTYQFYVRSPQPYCGVSPSCFSFCSALFFMPSRRCLSSTVSDGSNSRAFCAFWRANSF